MSGELLQSLDRFTKSLSVSRIVPAETFRLLAAVPMASAPLYIHALLKASISAPEKFMVGNKAKVFTSMDIAAVSGRIKKNVIKANDAMVEARLLLDQVLGQVGVRRAMVNDIALRAVDSLDVRIAMHVHGKAVPGRKVFKSIAEIGAAFYQDLLHGVGETVLQTPCPWHVVELAQVQAKPVPGALLRELNVTKEHAEAVGFVKGASVKAKDDQSASGTIEEVTAAGVEINFHDGKKKLTVVDFTSLVDNYLAQQESTVEIFDPVPNAAQTKDARVEAVKSKLRSALYDMYTLSDSNDKLRVHIKPQRGVIVKDNVKNGELRLVPMSPNIGVAAKVNIPTSAIACGEMVDDQNAFILPKIHNRKDETLVSAEDYVVPFWYVRSTSDKEKVNVHITSSTVTCLMTTAFGEAKTSIDVPLMRNTRALKAGAELLTYKADALTKLDPRKREAPAASAPSGGKRARKHA